MWKILVTTRVYTYASSAPSLSVHTLVIEFHMREGAMMALDNINARQRGQYKNGDPVVCTQYAIQLF
jgi:hypothetical protein